MSYEDEIYYLEPDDGSRKAFRRVASEIAARADARIAELETAITVRDTEIARLETDLELARAEVNRLDQRVDGLRSAIDHGQAIRAIDAARGVK